VNIVKIPPLKGKPFQYPTIRVINPGKGLNTLASPEMIADQEASDLQNVVFTELGTVTKGPGVTSWGVSLASNPKGLGSFTTQAGNHYVVTVDGSLLKHTSSASDSWTTIAGASLTANQDTTFTQLRTNSAAAAVSNASLGNYPVGTDALFVWNGVDGGNYWDGTTWHKPGTIPSAAFSIFYSGVHVCAGTSTNPSRLYFSDPNDSTQFVSSGWANPGVPTEPPSPNNPTDIPGTTSAATISGAVPKILDISPRDGDKITGLAKFNNVLIVFKNRSIWQVTIDPSSGSLSATAIITYLGAVSHRSIDNIDNDVFYLSSLGWFTLGYQESFYNIIRTNELSQRIHPLIQTINPTNLPRVSSIYYPYRFYSSFASGGSTTNNLTAVYDKRYDAWSKLNYITAESFTVFYDSTNTQHLLYADDTSANVWEISESAYNNNGVAIDAYWQSKAFDGGQPELYKRWIDITVYFRQLTGVVTVSVFADDATLVHQSTIGVAGLNGGIASTGPIGSELLGGNSSANTVGDSFPSNVTTSTTPTTNVPYRIRISTKSRTLMVKVEEPSDLQSTFALLGFAMTYRPYSHFVYPSNLKIQ